MSKNTSNKNPNKIRKVLDVVLTVVFIAIAVFTIVVSGLIVFVNTTYTPFFVNGQSMYPTLNENTTNTNGNKLGVSGGNFSDDTYYHVDYGYMDDKESTINKLERFDIVIVERNGSSLIKRLIGLPGETISFTSSGELNVKSGNDFVKINQPIDGQYLVGNYPTGEIVIPEGKYYVCGDNRSHSNDSRSFGAIDKSQIEGKVVAVVGYCEAYKKENSYDVRNIKYTWPRFF